MFVKIMPMPQSLTICVCGAGTMGSGIAQVAAQNGFKTIQFDVNADMLAVSKKNIAANLEKLVQKGKMTPEQAANTTSNLSFTSNLGDCIADVVIEAIVEKLEIKTTLFQQLAALNNPTTILATNTSSIAVSSIAATIPNPSRVAGMHFFNPAPLMQLVEVIRAEQSSDETVAMLVKLAKDFKKVSVVCKDAPGFIVNRVARHYYLEALKLVDEGKATVETVDALMENAGFKMGPFRLMDLIGMDINYSVSNIVWEALGKPVRLTPSPLQKHKVDVGELGKKTGKGFYEY
ncbi:MAG: 3-hydroxybutyryl-CoA dehydrogenase [Filimonas sp.]|nr:3-hydroxybutyryl-CoA dehydrogenase [Filimonas sp.]